MVLEKRDERGSGILTYAYLWGATFVMLNVAYETVIFCILPGYKRSRVSTKHRSGRRGALESTKAQSKALDSEVRRVESFFNCST